MSSDHDDLSAREGRPERVRPRRLEPDTLSYLEEVNESFVQNLKDGDVETSRMLLWNVLEEIAPRIASAASDRHACAYIEVLVDHMSAQQLRFFLHKMEGYFSHLWTNRYSSHVLQRVLSKVGAIVENEVKGETADDDDDDRAAGVPEMATLVVTMCAEVQNEWLTLINDVSASHVMRAVFCALAGRAPVVEKRGKKGKHKALQFQANPSDAASGSTEVPAAFQDTLAEMLELVLASSDGKLMELMSDSHAGPVLSMAVRVAPASIQSKVIFKLLKWNDEERSKQRFYDFAGDSVASHFLEAVCHSCDEDVWTAVFERCLQGRLLEFAEHAISNFVVQNFIQRTPTPEFAETVLDELQGALWSLLSMHRAGVIWRLAELCVRFKLREKSFFLALVAGVEKLESAKPEPARRDVVSALIGLQLSNNQNSRLTLNVPGARIIETMLKFPTDVATPLTQSILKLNSLQLVALAKDSTGSRCLVEPIWASESDDAKLALYEKLKGQFGSLVLDRNGSFTVLKCFDVMPLAEKTAIVDELAAVDGKLAGSHFASMVLTHCNVHEFKSNREKWLSSHERKKKVKELFSDFLGDESNKRKPNKSADDDAPRTSKKAKRAKKEKI
ncbi:hypothetical protein H310_10170 [Aphanomyces invadans]|uniref:Pumilio domain-containing protein NOP9 n=1 Tax=Aphanomyces invadans TaxID=157072 RepID=A0A024TS02_9STRA|nr:hypothetical protein H310_10170 [Aphanomyces invadans]ETV96895.1 hypothetical protein H310_10170 [Aphanomyces invadans]|eukprot:XP_008874672.1 hypothetical protein H310_10170 [Aphanomyces invadans]